MPIQQVPVRATISGGGLQAATPFILSFYIRQSRNELSSFSLSIKTVANGVDGTSGGIISFVVNNHLIFSGILLSAHCRPCFDDPAYTIIDANGTDVRKWLEYKKFTRRCTDTISSWALITGVVRRGLKSTKLAYRERSNLGGGFYLSYDSLDNSDARTTNRVKDYLDKASGPLAGSGKDPWDIVPYANIVTTIPGE